MIKKYSDGNIGYSEITLQRGWKKKINRMYELSLNMNTRWGKYTKFIQDLFQHDFVRVGGEGFNDDI